MRALAETLGVSLRTLGASLKILGAATAVKDLRLALAAKVVMAVVDGAMCSAISSEIRELCPFQLCTPSRKIGGEEALMYDSATSLQLIYPCM
jgi:hypothetical protein